MSPIALRLPRWWPTAALGVVLGYLVIVPLLLLIVSSVKPTGFPLDPGFTLNHYREVYSGGEFWRLLRNTSIFVVGSTALALTAGAVLAWLVERTDLPGRRLVRALIILPMATPPLLLAIAWVMLLSPRIGFFNDVLKAVFGLDTAPFNIFTMAGMIFVESLALVPSTYLILAPAFRNMDPNLEEAALASGATPGRMIRRILLPLLRPALLSAAIYLVIVGFVVFDIPGTIGMPVRIFVLSSQIYYWAALPPAGLPLYGQVSAMATLFLGILIALGLVFQYMTRRAQRFVTVTGKGFRVRPFPLGRWRWPAFTLVGVYFFLAVLAPLGILVWTSLLPYQARVSWEMMPLLTLANHADFLRNERIFEATANSLIVAVVAATGVSLLAALVAWVVVRSRAPGRRVLDFMAFMPIAIPGVMVGVALIYVYLSIRILPIYGSIWIIAIAYLTTYMSYGSRAMNGVMLQLHRELEEAAATSGAAWFRTFRRITVPLILPAIAAVWIWVVAHALRELSSALMLQGRDNVVLSTLLWDYWSGGLPTKAAAVGVWLMLGLVAIVALWQVLSRREAGSV